MMNMNLLNRSGLAAIAAATAFITTPALAQDGPSLAQNTGPVAAEPAPIVADAPLPSEPAATPVPEVTSEPATAAPVVTKSVRTAKPAARAVRTAVAAPIAVRTAAPVAATTPVAALTAPAVAPADPAMVAPILEPVAAAPVADTSNNDMLPIAGAAGLGILALAGAGFAMRRRRSDDEVVAEDEWVEPEAAVAQPLPIAPVATAPISAFAWDDKPAAVAPAPVAAAPTGLSRIEAAKRGPTPDNPSASLKKRLSRAAFFDQRERQVAAGEAAPIDAMAGLPEAMDPVEPQPAKRTAPSLGMGFNHRFQPA